MPPFPNFEFVVTPDPQPEYYILTAVRKSTGTMLRELFMYYPNEREKLDQDVMEFMNSISNSIEPWYYNVTLVSRHYFEQILMKKRNEEKWLSGVA